MNQLKQLEQKLIDSAKAKQEAIDAAVKAEQEYDKQWEQIAKANPEFKAAWAKNESARVAAREAKEVYSVEKFNAVQVLSELSDHNDMKVIDAFAYQHKKVVELRPNDELVMALVKANALGLLLPDTKKIDKLVTALAYKDESNNYLMPEWFIHQYSLAIGVGTEIKPTISDPKIAAKAK